MCNSLVGYLGYSTIQSRTWNSKHLRSPKIDSKEQIPLCSQAGRYDNPIPTRFLAPIDSSTWSIGLRFRVLAYPSLKNPCLRLYYTMLCSVHRVTPRSPRTYDNAILTHSNPLSLPTCLFNRCTKNPIVDHFWQLSYRRLSSPPRPNSPIHSPMPKSTLSSSQGLWI